MKQATATHLTRKEVGLVSFGFVVWRLLVFGIGKFAGVFFEYEPSFPYAFTRLPFFNLPQWLYSWANFDGVHYLTIIEKGYLGTALIQAFFPGYPGISKGMSFLIGNQLLAALAVSNLAALLLALLLYWWLKTEVSTRGAWVGLIALGVFPTAFFLGAVYSESVFLCFVIGAFLAARRQIWWLAGVCALAASATRLVGVLLVPALLIEIWQQVKEVQSQASLEETVSHVIQKRLPAVMWILFGTTGLFVYMFYLHRTFNDALFFLHVQSEFGGGRSESLVMYPQVVWRYLKIIWTYQPHDWKYFAYLQEAVVGIGGAVVFALTWSRSRWSYWFFSLGVFLVPTLTGNFSSMPRYVLPCLVMWLALAQLLSRAKPWVLGGYLLCSAVLLTINTMLFIQGYWVA